MIAARSTRYHLEIGLGGLGGGLHTLHGLSAGIKSDRCVSLQFLSLVSG